MELLERIKISEAADYTRRTPRLFMEEWLAASCAAFKK